MKCLTQMFLAVLAIALVSAGPAEKSVHPPPDDPTDVNTVQKCLPHGCVTVNRDGDVIQVSVNGEHLQNYPLLAPALRRLRHVHSLGTFKDADRVLETVKLWPILKDADVADVTADGIGNLKGMKYLSTLQIQDGNVTDAMVRRIGKLKNLLTLSIRARHITDACMKDIAALPRLKNLNLNKTATTDRGLAELTGMKLESLELRTTRITDRGIDAIKDMRTLTLLDVFDTKVTNTALAKLKGIPGLKVRGLPREELHEVPDDPTDVAAIQAASDRISTAKDNVTDNVYQIYASSDKQKPRIWMRHLQGLHNLKELDLPFNRTEDDDLALLMGLRTLEKLDVSSNRFSDAGLKCIGTLTSLRELDLSGCTGITSGGMKYVGQLENLKVLDMGRTPVTDDGLRYLTKLTKLRRLNLSRNMMITDAGLANLGLGLASLDELFLGGTKITDRGLEHLRGLKKFWPASSVAIQASREMALFDSRRTFRTWLFPTKTVAPASPSVRFPTLPRLKKGQ